MFSQPFHRDELKVVGYGYFQPRKSVDEKTKTNQAQFCHLQSALQAHPCGDGSQLSRRVWDRQKEPDIFALEPCGLPVVLPPHA